jgi:glycyl-tRNA synthetase
VTVDHQSLEDEAVTVRDRDTWEQERVKVSDLSTHLLAKFAPEPSQ